MLYAFFDREERIDQAAMCRQVDALIRGGVHGIAVLGLACELNKLSVLERRALLDCVADSVNGRVPLSVTIGEPSVPGQIEFARAAKAAGASWVILQTPPVRGAGEDALVRFFGAVAEKSELPIGLQIAPAYLGLDMSAASLRTLRRQHRNVVLLKIESDPLTTARLIEDTDGAFQVFNGRAGLEMTHNLDAGCVGIIPGGESADRLARIYDLHRSTKPRDKAEAERQYRMLRSKLVFYFAQKRVPQPEDLADEVMVRVLSQIAGGANIHVPLASYCLGVARNVLLEYWRKPSPQELCEPEPEHSTPHGLHAVERTILVEECLRPVPAEERSVLLEYYSGDRIALAAALAISQNALRIRAHRTKERIAVRLSRNGGRRGRT